MKKSIVLFINLIVLLILFSSCDLAELFGSEDGDGGSAPTHHAEGITFTDTDTDNGQIGGTINIIKAIDETDINTYVVYYSVDGTNASGQAIIELSKTGGNLQYLIPLNTNIAGINYFLVRTKNSHGEMNTGVNHLIVDPQDIVIPTEPVDLEVNFRASVQEVYNYNVYTRSNKNDYINNFRYSYPTSYIGYETIPGINDNMFNIIRMYYPVWRFGIVTTYNNVSYNNNNYLNFSGNTDDMFQDRYEQYNTYLTYFEDNEIVTQGNDLSQIFYINISENFNNYFIYTAPVNYTYNNQLIWKRSFAIRLNVNVVRKNDNSIVYSYPNQILISDYFNLYKWYEKVSTAVLYYKVNQIIATKSDTAEFTNIYINTANCISFEIIDNNLHVFLKDVSTKITGVIATFDVVNPNTNENESYSLQIQ